MNQTLEMMMLSEGGVVHMHEKDWLMTLQKMTKINLQLIDFHYGRGLFSMEDAKA